MEGGDVGVVQGCKDLGLSLESGESFFVLGELIGQDLDRDIPAELCIAGAVDLASSRQESPGATGRSLYSLLAACFRGGATISRPYSS